VSTEEAKKLYNDLEMDYFIESSAKTGLNAKEIFIQAAKLLFYEYQKLLHLQENVKKEHKKLELNNINNKKKKACC
jgi:GTPase SAR1 family protein